MIQMSRVTPSYFPLEGGLDLLTPAIVLPPGRCIDAQNYEPEISGGYRRIDGYERFDGRSSPTGANYWLIPAGITGPVTPGDIITGLTSGATAKVLATISSGIVAGDLTGTFTTESFTISAVVQGFITGTPLVNSATSQSENADYLLLAANNQREKILTVPGSGKIRGVWVYKDVVYAFRDNENATAGNMYKATATGWQQIIFGSEVQFSGAVGQIFVGNNIVGATSGATATVAAALLRTGTWTASGVGTLVLSGVTGTFTNGEAIQVLGVTKVTASSASTEIVRQAGGLNGIIEFVNYNFSGSTSTQKMYGADGVNLGFEFDGTTYVPIRTGMATDTPEHVTAWKNYLIFSFLGSVQLSSIAAPYMWSVVTGASEIATGDPVTGFMPQTGNSSGASLAIFTKGKTFLLYGSSAANFQLVPSAWDLGYSTNTMQQVGNDPFGLTARGVQRLMTTLNYGDFEYTSISHLIQPFINSRRGLETASTTLHTKNQYRLFFSDGYGLIVGLTGDKTTGVMPIRYPIVVRCICTSTITTGAEVTYFGSDDGYVYQNGVGSSFDGVSIESYVRLPFNNEKSPQMRKRIRRAVLEIYVVSYSQVNVTYDLGYGNPNVEPSAAYPDQSLIGAGGYWDQFIWDQFTWDTQVVQNNSISINGTEKNMSLLFYSNRAQDMSHTVQGVTVMYSPRRLER